MSIATIGQTLGRTARLRDGQTVACKCQICNCGSHKCPSGGHIHTHHYDPKDTTSAYQKDYPHHSITQRVTRDGNNPKPQLTQESGKFAGVTSNKADFPAWDAKPSTPYRPQGLETAIVGAAPFDHNDFITEQHSQFGKFGPQPITQSCAPKARPMTTSKFDGTTTKSSDFKNWSGVAKPANSCARPAQLHTNGAETRDFQTEAALKFTEHAAAKRASIIPPQRTTRDLPFEGNTTQRTDFHEWPGAKPSAIHKPKNDAQPVSETRDFTSETSREFGSKGYGVRESYAPKHDWSIHRLPFDATTSNQTYFKHHHGQPAKMASRPYDETRELLVGNDPISFQTEAGTQYVKKGYGVRESYAPKPTMMSTDKLDGTTTNKQDYKRHDVGAAPARLAHQRETHHAVPEDRDFTSSTLNSFVDYGVNKRDSFKPKNGGVRNIPFEGETTNRAHFTEHAIHSHQPCPAVNLPPAERKTDGHMAYTLQPETKRWAPL